MPAILAVPKMGRPFPSLPFCGILSLTALMNCPCAKKEALQCSLVVLRFRRSRGEVLGKKTHVERILRRTKKMLEFKYRSNMSRNLL